MELNAIILELLGRIKVLEDKVSVLERQMNGCQNEQAANRPPFPARSVSPKYKKLAEYLYRKWEKTLRLSYGEIESILGFARPESAHTFPKSYWANTKNHSYASAWLEVGYKARVEYETRSVTFERIDL